MHYISLINVFYFLLSFFNLGHFGHEILPVVKNAYEKHLLLATVSGYLYLFNKYTGEQIWKTKMDQFVKTQNTNGSMLIPNPISGQLYIFQPNSNDQNLFTQLEHSVYDYVRQTPLFMENMLLTGSKNDNWLSIDLETGKILNKYRTGSSERCPQYDTNTDNNHTLHIGVCEYNLVVSDASTRHIMYNVMLNSLATHAVTDLEHFGLQLYGSSDSGLVVAKYTSEGTDKGWSCVLDSSVIGFYAITSLGVLSRLHFTTMSHDTIGHFIRTEHSAQHKITFKKSMFFGQNNDNWYVLKAYITEGTAIRSLARVHMALITGPMNISYRGHYAGEEGPTTGFYEMPVEVYLESHDRTVNSQFLLDFDRQFNNNTLVLKNFKTIFANKLPKLAVKESWSLVVITLLVMATFVMTIVILCHLKKQNGKYVDTLPIAAILPASEIDKSEDDDAILIGDISYYPREVLGYGTNGTAVFRGVFHGNNRAVAVKRLIKSEQSHYELQFLRQSFDCSFLIKCFYITQSREFTFLALELCECTLEGFVTDANFQQTCGLDTISACKQMMSGVQFLHEKGIVHRDLKPRNVLLMKQNKVTLRPESSKVSWPCPYKIVISDFGLSRQSLDHCQSITKTGCGGTSGYMAPELSREEVTRITTSADIFSCGILFYYIHTNGQHPFGAEILSRQHRIHQGQFRLNGDLFNDQLLLYFITCMLQASPVDRPSADEILNGPLFWKPVEKLAFLSDLSDFVEKAEISLQLSLDRLSGAVFPDKWVDELEPELVENMLSQRSYKTKQLSHLIRALRNKRNHFHDLPVQLSEKLFCNSLDGLANYINTKFPHLYTTLYRWTRQNLAHFTEPVHRYFPSQLHRDQCTNNSNQLSDENGVAITENGAHSEDEDDDNGLLSWRKPLRKRPGQQKKHRGQRNNKPSVQ